MKHPVVTICGLYRGTLTIADNETGKCRECGTAVQFRPYAPKGPKLCLHCAVATVNFEEAVLDTKTQRLMTAEAAAHLRKKQH